MRAWAVTGAMADELVNDHVITASQRLPEAPNDPLQSSSNVVVGPAVIRESPSVVRSGGSL